ncbi:hypothetical protein Tco_0251710 [Tanacetum coccineum]
MMELTLEESVSMFMAKISKRHDENTNLIKEIQASTHFALRNQEASIKALDIQVRQMSIILHKKLSGNLQSSTKIKPRVNDETISTSVANDMPSIRRIDASQYAVLNLQNRNLFSESKKRTLPSPNYLIDDYWDKLKETEGVRDLEAHCTNAKPLDKALPRKEKDIGNPLDPRKTFLSTAHAIINMFKAKITLSVGNDKIFFKSNKPTSNIIKKVYALSLIKSMELDLEARLMGNALRKNRSRDPNLEDSIELNNLNEPIEHRRNQVKVFIPTIDEGEGMDEPIIEDIETKFDNI